MKTFIITTVSVLAFSSLNASANEVFSKTSLADGIQSPSNEAAETLRDCLQSDAQIASSKAVGACTKSLRIVAPSWDLKSDIYTRRALLYVSSGRYDKASRDFKSAAKLNKQNEFAYLGQGFAAMLDEDYQEALSYFENCMDHDKAAPLAIYGRAMTHELKGNLMAAKADYQLASEMRPNWDAPQIELARFRTSG